MSLRDDINEAIKGKPGLCFEFVEPHRFQGIIDQIAELFLQHGKNDLESIWLWERLREELSSSQPSDPISELEVRLKPDQLYWFIASEENSKYWIAEATGSSIPTVLREMYCFEYYILDRHMNWLICENHHGVLIEAKSRGMKSN